MTQRFLMDTLRTSLNFSVGGDSAENFVPTSGYRPRVRRKPESRDYVMNPGTKNGWNAWSPNVVEDYIHEYGDDWNFIVNGVNGRWKIPYLRINNALVRDTLDYRGFWYYHIEYNILDIGPGVGNRTWRCNISDCRVDLHGFSVLAQTATEASGVHVLESIEDPNTRHDTSKATPQHILAMSAALEAMAEALKTMAAVLRE